MNKKKNIIIVIVVVAFAFIVGITSKYYPPSKNTDSAGTIGVVKKYNSRQMNEKDVKLKNIMLKDTATIRQSVERLKVYKNFITGLAVDLGKWNEEVENAKKKSTKALKDEKILTEKAASFVEYKTYIEKNIGAVDTTINLFTMISKTDTLNLEAGIENTIVAYENFRIQVAQKFETMLASVPTVHNAFIKNGLKGIIGNTNGSIGIFITNSALTMCYVTSGNKLVGNNITFAVIALNGKTAGAFEGKSVDLNAMINSLVGIYNSWAKTNLENYSLNNITANSKVMYGIELNSTIAGNTILGTSFTNKINYNLLTGNKMDFGVIVARRS